MTAAPKPNSPSPAPGNSPAEEPQGALGAILVGAAILLVAALLIFWPSSETAGEAGGKAGRVGGQQAAYNGDGEDNARGRGISPREVDPAQVPVGVTPRVRDGILAPNNGMAMAPTREPEPTSFPSVAAEITYLEKKLEAARESLKSRGVFVERMKKMQERAPVSDFERTSARAKIVQDNYDKAQARVDDLEYKIKLLRKQGG